jgi:hypothetical protein
VKLRNVRGGRPEAENAPSELVRPERQPALPALSLVFKRSAALAAVRSIPELSSKLRAQINTAQEATQQLIEKSNSNRMDRDCQDKKAMQNAE